MALKAKTVIISPQAETDLEELYDYLYHEFGKSALEKFYINWSNFLSVVTFHPRIFPILHKRKNLRKFAIHSNTLVVYKPSKHFIEIVTLFNTKHNPIKLKKLI